jgi:TatD DNase family protein
MFLDAHAHLQAFGAVETIKKVLDVSSCMGVKKIFCNAVSPGDWDKVAEVSRLSPAVVPFYGVHPWFAADEDTSWPDALRSLLAGKNAFVGEAGLDGNRGPEMEAQLPAFEEQIMMAGEARRPISLHIVDAWGPALSALKKFNDKDLRFMVHSFSGSADTLREIVGLGGYVSFSPKMNGPGHDKMKKAFLAAPLERLLLETDIPAPGRLEERYGEAPEIYPNTLIGLYERAAGLKNMTVEKLARTIWDNGTIFTD